MVFPQPVKVGFAERMRPLLAQQQQDRRET
jgi:hypothetical protein